MINKIIKMKYPKDEKGINKLYDGKIHNIIISNLESFFSNGNEYYVMQYTDISLRKINMVTIVKNENGKWKKVPLDDYSKLTAFLMEGKTSKIDIKKIDIPDTIELAAFENSEKLFLHAVKLENKNKNDNKFYQAASGPLRPPGPSNTTASPNPPSPPSKPFATKSPNPNNPSQKSNHNPFLPEQKENPTIKKAKYIILYKNHILENTVFEYQKKEADEPIKHFVFTSTENFNHIFKRKIETFLEEHPDADRIEIMYGVGSNQTNEYQRIREKIYIGRTDNKDIIKSFSNAKVITINSGNFIEQINAPYVFIDSCSGKLDTEFYDEKFQKFVFEDGKIKYLQDFIQTIEPQDKSKK